MPTSPWSTPRGDDAEEPWSSALKSAETAALVAARRRAAAILAEAEVDERRAARSEATASGAPAPELGKSGTDGDLRSLVQKQIALEELDANSGIIHPGAVLGEDANALDRWRQRQFNVGWTDIVRGANERSLHPAAGYKPLNETRRPGWWGAGLLGTACYANESLDIESRESMRTFALALALPCRTQEQRVEDVVAAAALHGSRSDCGKAYHLNRGRHLRRRTRPVRGSVLPASLQCESGTFRALRS